MLDLAITWLPIVGAVVFGSGVSVWYGAGDKSFAIWIGFLGAVILALGFSINLQKIVWDWDAKPAGPADSEVNRQRAYVLVEASEIRYLAQEKPIEAWISLKNNGLSPAFDLQRTATIFAAKYPHNEFEPVEPGNARAVLGPSGAVDFAPIRMSRTLTFLERTAIANGEAAIYVYGAIKYRDIYQITRCTNFRLMHRGNGGGISAAPVPLEQLPEGNNYDCPD
jgi:hypothetical protein